MRSIERDESCHYTKTVRKRGRRPRSDSIRYLRREKRGSAEREQPHPMTTSPPDTEESNSTSLPDTSGCMAPPDRRRYTIDSTDGPLANSTDFLKGPTDFNTADSPYTTQTQAFNGLFQSPIGTTALDPNQTSLSPGQVRTLIDLFR